MSAETEPQFRSKARPKAKFESKTKPMLLMLAGGLLAAGVTTKFIMPTTSPDQSALINDDSAWEGPPPQTLVVQTNQAEGKTLVPAQQFYFMLAQPRAFDTVMQQIDREWDISYVPMLMEIGRFLPGQQRNQVIRLLQKKTGEDFGLDFDKWRTWSWRQDITPHPQYANFKSLLYSRLDPTFAEYFVDTKDSEIRLDEITWGGVRRDGIPPLNKPKMLPASEANYLADTDVVFGIELNGDARAYPKRVLAWHEMFKDTIGGESVCGVY